MRKILRELWPLLPLFVALSVAVAYGFYQDYLSMKRDRPEERSVDIGTTIQDIATTELGTLEITDPTVFASDEVRLTGKDMLETQRLALMAGWAMRDKGWTLDEVTNWFETAMIQGGVK
jgi:hypothetical protein